MNCYRCGNELVWDNDYDRSDITLDDKDEGAVISIYHCPFCGMDYEMYEPSPEEQSDYPYYNKN